MADSAVAITAGSGTNIDTRTETTNSNHRQVIVIGDPATNAGVAPVDVTAGLKVDLGADNDVTVSSGTITTVSTVTSVTNDVNIADGGNSITVDDGGTTLSVDDGAGSLTVDNGGTFAVQSTLQTGSNTIGKLAANSGVDIGDVDVTSLDGVAAEGAALGNGILIQGDDGTDRKNINVDATTGDVQVDVTNTVTISGTLTGITNDVSIDDGGNSITIDGTLTGITNDVNIADGGNSITVDNGGTFAVQSTLQAGTNTNEFVGDVADDAVAAGNPVHIGGLAKETDGTDPGSVSAEGDRTELISDRNRRLLVNTTHPNLFSATDNQSTAQTNTQLQAAPGANLSLYITDIVISNGATAGNVKIVEDTSGTPVDIVEIMYFAANGGAALHFTTPIRVTANTNVGYTSATVTTHSITMNGYIAP